MRSVGCMVLLAATLGCGAQRGNSGTAGTGSNGNGGGGPDAGSPPPVSRSLDIHLTGSGIVRSATPATSCRSDCRLDVGSDQTVLLTAAGDTGYAFTGWQGDCSGSGPCSLAMAGDHRVTAVFESRPLPPPAQCVGLQPVQSTPVSGAVGSANEPDCGPGMGDGSGAIGLQTSDSIHMGSHAVFLHFMDGSSGTQKNWTGRNGSTGSSSYWMPQPQGFIVVYDSGPGTGSVLNLEAWSPDGKLVRSSTAMSGDTVTTQVPSGGLLVAGVFGWLADVAKKRQAWMFGPDLSVRWMSDLSSQGVIFGLGCDANGRCLLITDGGQAGRITAQWFETNGAHLTDEFLAIDGFQAGSNTWFDTAPLIGGGLAIRRVDQFNDATGRPYRTAQWLGVADPGRSGVGGVPGWLKDRPNTSLAIVRGVKAYAVLPMGAPEDDCAQRIEVLAPDGTSCAALDVSIGSGRCRTDDVAISLTGTPIQPLPRSQDLCSYRWWKDALR
jgi:hypothetical protein